jgi:hypothetical protein
VWSYTLIKHERNKHIFWWISVSDFLLSSSIMQCCCHFFETPFWPIKTVAHQIIPSQFAHVSLSYKFWYIKQFGCITYPGLTKITSLQLLESSTVGRVNSKRWSQITFIRFPHCFTIQLNENAIEWGTHIFFNRLLLLIIYLALRQCEHHNITQ